MYITTEMNSVSHGTAMAEMPSSRPTMGANAKIMMASFSATCDSVKYGSPVRELAPDEHHRRAGRRCKQDQAGDVAVDLLCGQIRRKHMPDEDPAEQRHRERLDQPVHAERHADAAPVLSHLVQRAEVDLHAASG